MELHPHAQELLRILQEREEVGVQALQRERDWSHGRVMRPAQWLADEGLVAIETGEEAAWTVTERGERVLQEGLPEQQVLEAVAGGDNTVEAVRSLGDVAGPGIGKAREKGLITIDDGVLSLTGDGEQLLEEEHDEMRALRAVKEGDTIDEDTAETLADRGLIQEEVETRHTLRLTEEGAAVDVDAVEDAFDVTAETGDALVGRRHFARAVYDYIRRTWMAMGFQEMDGPLVVPSLLNFDALYTPQDHPARELHDTFFMDAPADADLDAYGAIVDWIRATHEDGWETGSRGWQYAWWEDEAARNVLRTHTTAVSAQTLADLTEDDLPAKFFGLGRNFRNETVDWKHLAEFNQSEGIVVAEDVTFRHLVGYLHRFFAKLGYEEVRFRPAYYPYTELSIEVDVYDDHNDEWMGLGGAGMFRPEVVKPLLGFEVPVLAWGLGPGRIIMKHHDITDIRDMYRNDLQQLRSAAGWLQ